jgi:uncharacterized protein (TIGR02118 family)
MIKLTFCLRRLPHLSREEFQAYWIGPHREIMIRHKAMLGYRRYVQADTIGGETAARIEGSRGGPEPYDGTAEVWYDDMESFERALSSDAGKTAGRELIEDEKCFINMANSPVWLSEEKVIEDA